MNIFLQPSATKRAFSQALEDYHHIPKGIKAGPAFAKVEVKLLRAALTGVAEVIQRIALFVLSKIHRRFHPPSSIKAPIIGTYLSTQALFKAAKADRVYQNWQAEAKKSINKIFDDNIRDCSDSCLKIIMGNTPDPIEHQIWGKKVQKLEEDLVTALDALRTQVTEEDDLVTQGALRSINERIGEHKTAFLKQLENTYLTVEELTEGYHQAAREVTKEFFTELIEQTFKPEVLARRYERTFDATDWLPIVNALNEERAEIDDLVEQVGTAKDFRRAHQRVLQALDSVEEKIDRVVDEVVFGPTVCSSEEAEIDFEKKATDDASRIFKELQTCINHRLKTASVKLEDQKPTHAMLDEAIKMQSRITTALSKKIDQVKAAKDAEGAYQAFLQSLDAFVEENCRQIDGLFVPKEEPKEPSIFARIHLR